MRFPWLCVCFHAYPASFFAKSPCDDGHIDDGPCHTPGCECTEFRQIVIRDRVAATRLQYLADIAKHEILDGSATFHSLYD